MVCRTTPGNSAFTAIAREVSGLTDVQVLSLFHEVRREAPVGAVAPSAEEAINTLRVATSHTQGVHNTRTQRSLGSWIERATANPDVDARTYHAWRTVIPRAIAARRALDTELADIARGHRASPEEVREAFDTIMRQIDRGGDPANDVAPEGYLAHQPDIPSDRRTRYALANLRYGGLDAAQTEIRNSNRAAIHGLAATHDAHEARAHHEAVNEGTFNCPNCGQFQGDAHVCPPSTDTAPRARRTPVRTYANDGVAVQMTNRSQVLADLRNSTGGNVEVPVVVDYPDGNQVSGEVTMRRTPSMRGPRGIFTQDNVTVGCTCPDYQQRRYCDHIRDTRDRVRAIVVNQPPPTPPASALANVADGLRNEYDQSLIDQQRARETFNALMADHNATRYTDSMPGFQAAWDAHKARYAAGDTTIPYMTGDNVTNGLGDRTTGRSFGVEVEVDFPEDMTYTAKETVAREIYEAGLSTSPRVQGWRAQARAGGAAMGTGYTDNPNAWSVEFDSSVDGLGGRRGCEIVSPIMYDTPETWQNIDRILAIVRANGGQATPRTGLHVNIGARDYDHTVENHNRLLNVTAAYEDVIVRAAHNPQSGVTHRGRDYCRPLTVPAEGYRTIREAQNGIDPRGQGSHRAMVNLDHVPAEGGTLTNSTRVEVRIFDGTTDPGRLQTNIKVALGLVNAGARGVETPPVREPAGTHRAANSGPTGRARRLGGQEWAEDSRSMRTFADLIFTRDEDKNQLVGLFASTRWQRG